MTEESLQKLFGDYECKKVKVMTLPKEHIVAYAFFDSKEKTSEAFNALNKKKLDEDGKTELMLSRPIYYAPTIPATKRTAPKKAAATTEPEPEPAKDTVILSNLPEAVKSEAELKQVFEGMTIKESRFEGRTAIVRLKDAKEVEEAIKSLTGATVEGVEVSIKLYSPKKIRKISLKKKKSPRKATAATAEAAAAAAAETPQDKKREARRQHKEPEVLFDFPAKVRNLPYTFVDGEALKDKLAKYNIVGVDIKLNSRSRSKGYAVVGFKSEEDRTAAEGAEDIEIGGRKISIRKLIRRERPATVGDNSKTPAPVRQQRRPKEVSDFVGIMHNLPFEVDGEDSIKEILGDITPTFCYVAKWRNRSKGYAVIGFNSKEDLDKAIETVSGTDVNGRKINITLPRGKK